MEIHALTQLSLKFKENRIFSLAKSHQSLISYLEKKEILYKDWVFL